MPSVPGDAPGCNLHFVLSLYTRHALRPVVPQRRALMETVAGIYPGASMLELEIAQIQARLGTRDERPDDLERAKVAAHTLGNMICAALLTSDLRGLEGG